MLHDLLRHCFWKKVWHIYCPGCGGTRAVLALWHLKPLQSLFYNPLPLLMLVDLLLCPLLLAIHPAGASRKCLRLLILESLIFLSYVLARDILLIAFGIDLLGDFIS